MASKYLVLVFSTYVAQCLAEEATSPSDTIITAHGVTASIAFLALLPIGAIILRLASLSPWVHAIVQNVAFALFIAAAGLGIWITDSEDFWSDAHPIIGIVLLGLLAYQGFAGLYHHKKIQKTGRRTWISYSHIWIGRIAIILGMINGGLGISLAGDVEDRYVIAYGVVAGVMGVLYIASAVYGLRDSRDGSSSIEMNAAKS